jgi:hypothetical protein
VILSAAKQRFLFAQLLDHFHLTPEELARLTDHQIHDLYLYPRREGLLIPPDEGKGDRTWTLAEELVQLELVFAIAPNMTEAQKEELRRQLRARYGQEAGNGEGNGQRESGPQSG